MNGDKRKFLFVSISGLISDIAWQVAKEGHEVRYCIEEKRSATSPMVSCQKCATGSARWIGPT